MTRWSAPELAALERYRDVPVKVLARELPARSIPAISSQAYFRGMASTKRGPRQGLRTNASRPPAHPVLPVNLKHLHMALLAQDYFLRRGGAW